MPDSDSAPAHPPSAAPPGPAPLFHLGHPDGDHLPFLEWPRQASQVVPGRRLLPWAAVAAGSAFLGQWCEQIGASAQVPDVALAWVLPFLLLLACMAILPFAARRVWERHYHHIAIGLAAVVGVWYMFFQDLPSGGTNAGFLAAHAGGAIAGSLGDYISFVFFMGTLFILSGGIVIRVRRRATPAVNTALLLVGTLLANVLGTTGAAMLLIRPYLRINHGHTRPFHIVFFIFLVANIGGGLTPLGPPLLMGYLKGMPFWWVAQRAWPMWLAAVALPLAVFFIIDSRAQRRQARAPGQSADPGPVISIFGISNLLLIVAVIAGVLLHQRLVELAPLPWRELIMIGAVTLSLWSTPHPLHVENVFSFAPLREVACLFAGIFVTMVPALNYVTRHAGDAGVQAALRTPGQFYFSAGALSSILDNAPTYLVFLQAALSRANPMHDGAAGVGALLADPQASGCALAAALGSVFFGAMTYIGNGPNFMVKSIAESAGVKCPSFFGYILFFALPILLPLLILIWAVFLWPHAP